MNASAQDSAPPSHVPTPKEKTQALAALGEARSALFPLRRKGEARQLLARIAPLLALAGDTAGAQEVLTLLPTNQREEIQLEIVAAQISGGDLAAALETATAISEENARAAALLQVVQAQAKSGKFDAAMRTAGLIPPGRIESVKALVEVAKEQGKTGKRSEARQLLQRAAAEAAGLINSNEGAPECGLSVLAQIANAQQSLGESTEAVKTLRLAEGRVSEADQGCRFGATRFLPDEGQPEAVQKEMAQFRESLLPSVESAENEEQNEEDSSSVEERPVEVPAANSFVQLRRVVQTEQSTLTPEEARAALDSLRGIKPLNQRAQAAMGISQMMMAKGKAREAEEAIRIGLQAADTVQDENMRGILLASKAHALAAAKDWEGARATVEEITNAPQRTAALADIAFCAAEDGHAQLALSWAIAEASPVSEATVLVSLAEALLHQPQQTQQIFFVRY
jgi:tetratricopeptide (TPR) repeat protein